MKTSETSVLRDLVDNPPMLHVWDGQSRVGGFQTYVATRLVDFVSSQLGGSQFKALETGAGLTTLIFKALGASTVTSIDPTENLGARIHDEAIARGIDSEGISIIEERSELALPQLVANGFQCDVFLIDGAHGWPNVFVDFCYGYMCLRQGGLLLVDDIQLYSVQQLFLFLSAQPGFTCISNSQDRKLAAFTKDTAETSVTPWESMQPFIMENTSEE